MATHAHTTPTRRRDILTGAATLMLTAPAAVSAASLNPDAGMIRHCQEYHRVHTAWQDDTISDDEADELTDARDELLRTLYGWVPNTPEGMRAKAGVGFSALLWKVDCCLCQTWREQASTEETVAIEALRDISGLPEPVKVLVPPRAPKPAAPPSAKPVIVCGNDAELISACAEYLHYRRIINSGAAGDYNENHPVWAAFYRTQRILDETEPKTMAGMLALARAAKREAQNPDGTEEPAFCSAVDWAWQIVNAILRQHGEVV